MRRGRAAAIAAGAAIFLSLAFPPGGPASTRPSAPAGLVPSRLTVEYRPDPLGIGTPRPRLGWALESPERGESQSAYRILVADSPQTNGSDSVGISKRYRLAG